MTTPGPATAPPEEDRRQVVLRRLVVVLIVLLCAAALVVAVNHTDTGESDVAETGPASVVEAFIPAPGSAVLRQAQIGLDLVAPWTGVLIVNGSEIPEDQLLRRPELYQVFFSPGDGKVIEQFPAGQNCVEALVWRVDSSRADARSIDWCFTVT